MQITPQSQAGGLGGPVGPSGTQQLTITIGTGNSDRLAHLSAIYNVHQGKLYVGGYDVNVGALYSVSVTSTGKVLFPPQSADGPGGNLGLYAFMPWPCTGQRSCSLTVTDSLRSSATVTLPPIKY